MLRGQGSHQALSRTIRAYCRSVRDDVGLVASLPPLSLGSFKYTRLWCLHKGVAWECPFGSHLVPQVLGLAAFERPLARETTRSSRACRTKRYE